MKALWLLMVILLVRAVNAEEPIEFPSSLPFGNKQKLDAYLRSNVFDIGVDIKLRLDPINDWWGFPEGFENPDPRRVGDLTRTLEDQIMEFISMLTPKVEKLDPSETYGFNYGTGIRVPGTHLVRAAYYGGGDEFKLVLQPDGTYKIPSGGTNVNLLYFPSIPLPFFHGVTSVEVVVTNGTQVTHTIKTPGDYSSGDLFIDAQDAEWIIHYSSQMMTSGLPGRVIIKCWEGMVVHTFDHATGTLISREMSAPRLTIRPAEIGEEGLPRVDLEIVSAPGTTLEVQSSSDFKTWKKLGTVSAYNGKVIFNPEVPSTPQFYRVRLMNGLSGYSLKSQ